MFLLAILRFCGKIAPVDNFIITDYTDEEKVNRMTKRIAQVCVLVAMLVGLLFLGSAKKETKVEWDLSETFEINQENIIMVLKATETMQYSVTEWTEVMPKDHAYWGLSEEEIQVPEVNISREERERNPVIGEMYAHTEPYLIGIDPGHLGYLQNGWRNTGAQSVLTGNIEYKWALEVGTALKEELLSRGYDVYMIRDTNELSEYPYNAGERAIAANEMKCDIVIAIHWDSYADGSANGYHVLYKGNRKSDNYLLAKTVSDAYKDAIKGAVKAKDPVERDDLWMLNLVEMPMIFIEYGFSSNISDATFIEDPDNHPIMAEGVANGVDAYFAAIREREAAAAAATETAGN